MVTDLNGLPYRLGGAFEGGEKAAMCCGPRESVNCALAVTFGKAR